MLDTNATFRCNRFAKNRHCRSSLQTPFLYNLKDYLKEHYTLLIHHQNICRHLSLNDRCNNKYTKQEAETQKLISKQKQPEEPHFLFPQS